MFVTSSGDLLVKITIIIKQWCPDNKTEWIIEHNDLKKPPQIDKRANLQPKTIDKRANFSNLQPMLFL